MAVEIANKKYRSELFVEFPAINIYEVNTPPDLPTMPYEFEWIEAPDPAMIIETDTDAFDFTAFSWVTVDGNFVGLRYQVTAPGVEPGTYTGSCRARIRDTDLVEHEFGPIPVTVVIEEDWSFHIIYAVAIGQRTIQDTLTAPTLFVLGSLGEGDEYNWNGLSGYIHQASLPTQSVSSVNVENGNILSGQVESAFYISGQTRGSYWRAGFYTDPHQQIVTQNPVPGVALSASSRGMIWNTSNSGFVRRIVQAVDPNQIYMRNSQTLAEQQVTVPGVELLRGEHSLDMTTGSRRYPLGHLLFCCKAGKIVLITDPEDLSTFSVLDFSAENGGADFRAAFHLHYDPLAGEGDIGFTEIDMLLSEDGNVFRSIDAATTFSKITTSPVLGSGHGLTVGLSGAAPNWARWIICGSDTSQINGPGDIGRNMIAYSDDFGVTWTEVPAPALPVGYSSWNGLYGVISNIADLDIDEGQVFMVGSINTDSDVATGVIVVTDTDFSFFDVIPQPDVSRIDMIAYRVAYIP